MGVLSRRWVWLVGVVAKRYIDFLILHVLIPTPLVFVLFCLLFVHKKKKKFRSCSGTF